MTVKTPENGQKSGPRMVQKWANGVKKIPPKAVKSTPKRCQTDPEVTQNGPELSQKCSETTQKWSHSGLQIAQKSPVFGPKMAQNG